MARVVEEEGLMDWITQATEQAGKGRGTLLFLLPFLGRLCVVWCEYGVVGKVDMYSTRHTTRESCEGNVLGQEGLLS